MQRSAAVWVCGCVGVMLWNSHASCVSAHSLCAELAGVDLRPHRRNQRPQVLGALLHVAGPLRGVEVNVLQPKPFVVSVGPLEVVHHRPREVALHLGTVVHYRHGHLPDVLAVIRQPERVFEGDLLFPGVGHVLLVDRRHAVLSDDDRRRIIPVLDVFEQLGHAEWRGVKPNAGCLWPDGHAEALVAAAVLVALVEGRVHVETEEVAGAFEELLLGWCEHRHFLAPSCFERFGVVAQINRVGEPAEL
mmetsp:Transcript_4083/g.10481  ORF Transcript_4083/g.10481 Transcript_4083/m.10481 type:complete len:247 (+) Transcript_4083:1842-2582(+)